MTRHTYFILGWLSFSMGLIGVLLPVVPTSPFMLLALWAFSRSSQRFHDWLYHHRLFGPPLQRWTMYRVIPLPAKITTIVFMSISLAYLIVFSVVPVWLIVVAGLLMLSAAIYIVTKPSKAPE